MTYADPIRTNQATFEITADLIDGLKSDFDTLLGLGWQEVTEAFTYASANTVTVASGATSRYQKGDKIALNNGGIKYFYVTNVASTILTLFAGDTYTLANTAISGVLLSRAGSPFGFPQYFTYAPTLSVTSGTLSLITIAKVGFALDGQQCHCFVTADFTLSGVSANFIDISLPIAPGSTELGYFGAGLNTDGSTEAAFGFTATGSVARIISFNQDPITVGARLVGFEMTYAIL